MEKKKKATAKKEQAQNICSRKDCIYHPPQYRNGTCDYIVIEGKSRRCPIENCDKYKKGERKRISTITKFSVVVEPYEDADADVAASADLLKDIVD